MYPSAIATLTNPNPSDKLNSPSHSSIESAQNDNIEQMQTFVGTLSSAVGTLVYDIRSPNSNGGGHVQSANKGGTGQTTYAKGDLLVATSSSVIAKLAVGANNTYLMANSNEQAGVGWASVTSQPNNPSVTTMIPSPAVVLNAGAANFIDTQTINSRSVMGVGLVKIPFAITANRMFFGNYSANTPGQLLIGMYPAHGGHSVFTASTATLTGATSTFSMALPSISIQPGMYYLGVAPISSCVVTFPMWQMDTSAQATVYQSVAGAPLVYNGIVSIVAGSLPASITGMVKPTTGTNYTPVIRFDS